jgi:pectate lyase
MVKKMKKALLISMCCCTLFLNACAQQRVSNGRSEIEGRALAFPGAEGFGQYTTGGRGGQVMIVTNLNDDGPGSLRDAVTKKVPRVIVFAISGTIHLTSRLNIAADVTIAGQSAPGGGICIADHPVALNGNNIIIRYLRFRMGDRFQDKGKVDGGGSDDALSGTRRNNIIIDHCSVSWSTDEVMSIYAGDSTTIQWNIISEPLNYSYHFETGDKDFEHHGYGGIWGGKHLSAHHNLFAHCNSRTPRFDGIRNSPVENVDYRNNVIYNWGHNNVYAGEGGNYNIVNNYYKYGPSTQTTVMHRIVNPFHKLPEISFGKYYINGNFVDGSPSVTKNNWSGVKMDKGTDADAQKATMNQPFPSVATQTHSAAEAYEIVLKNAGAVMPARDTLDARIVKDVMNRTGKLIDVQGGYPHGTPYSETIDAWPALQSSTPPKDTDQDGMPDEWERKRKLNPSDKADAVAFSLNKQFTNVEVYLNELAKHPL